MTKARLGQHFLRSPRAIRAVVGDADLRPGDKVLDAGAGDGGLTLPIAEAVGPTGVVWAVELDPDLAGALRRSVPPHVHVIREDILTFEFPKTLDAVVANPPFQVAAPFVERIAAAGIPRAMLVLPRELADRLTAPPGSDRYGKLTIRVGLLAEVERVAGIPRNAFDPPPEVPCAVVSMAPRPDRMEADRVVLDRVLDVAAAGWERKAKHALAPLAPEFRADSEGLRQLLVEGGFAERTASTLPPRAFADVARYLKERGKSAP